MSPKVLAPALRSKVSRDYSSSEMLWLRLNGFLSNKSKNTQKTYSEVVREWCRFLGAEAGTAEAAKLMVRATDLHATAYRTWLAQRPGQKPRVSSARASLAKLPSTSRRVLENADGLQSTLAGATIAKKFAALRRIYRMLIANDLGVTLNPFDSDRVPAPSPHSGRKRPTEMVDFSLVKKIISLPDTKQPKGIRDRALLALLFGAGLRRGEVIKLRLADVKRTPRGTTFLYLRSTKAKRDAEQAIPSWAANFLAELVAVRRAHKAQDGDYLFVSFRGKGGLVETNHPLSSHGIYQLFKAYCRAAGAGSHVSPHSARATAITRLLDEGVSHRDVQEFSRHASVQMVEVYDKRRVGVDQNPAKDLDYD